MLHISEIQKRGVRHPARSRATGQRPGALRRCLPSAFSLQPSAFSLQPPASRFLDPTQWSNQGCRWDAEDTTRTDGKYAPNFVREVIQVREAVTQRQRSMRERTSKLYYCNLVEITCVLLRSRQAYIPESCFLSVLSPLRSFTYPHSSVITKLSSTSQAIVLLPNFHVATASDIAMGIYSEGRSDVWSGRSVDNSDLDYHVNLCPLNDLLKHRWHCPHIHYKLDTSRHTCHSSILGPRRNLAW